MSTRDLFNRVKQTQTLAYAVISATADSTAIDMQGFQSIINTVTVGVAGITLTPTNKIELELLECDTIGGSYVQCAAADVQGAITGSTTGCFAVLNGTTSLDASVFKVGYIGGARFLKVRAHFSGTHSTGTGVGVVASQGSANTQVVV